MSPILPQLWRLLSRWRGYRYGALDHEDRRVDCTALWSSVLRDAWGRELVSTEVWQAINLSRNGAGPWDGVDALGDALGVQPVRLWEGNQPAAGRLSLCQSWKDLSEVGGAFVFNDDGDLVSRGHMWGWLSFGGWLGVVVESSGVGPRVWDGHGRRALADVVNEGGDLEGGLQPLDWGARARKWTSGTAWVELP